MLILHTSDWHVGRTFHGHQTLSALDNVLAAMADVVDQANVDVVLIAGDVFDTAVPSPDAHRVLAAALARIQAGGAKIVLSSGNHDSPARLGFLSAFTQAGGLYIHTDPAKIAEPTVLSDAYGEVKFFPIPYLEPALLQHLPGGDALRSQADALRWATDQIRAATSPNDRVVVAAHTFAAGDPTAPGDDSTTDAADRGAADIASSDLVNPDLVTEALAAPRDFTRGGVDVVTAQVFAGFSYAALGHLHGRSRLADNVRYSGAPLHYNFGEAHKPRGAWLVELGPLGFLDAQWVDLPVPRSLVELRGTVENLLTAPEYEQYRNHWVRGVLTDNERVIEPVRRLRQRFPYFADVAFAPERTMAQQRTYRQRVRQNSGAQRRDEDIADSFAQSVRNGVGLDELERALLAEVVETIRTRSQR